MFRLQAAPEDDTIFLRYYMYRSSDPCENRSWLPPGAVFHI